MEKYKEEVKNAMKNNEIILNKTVIYVALTGFLLSLLAMKDINSYWILPLIWIIGTCFLFLLSIILYIYSFNLSKKLMQKTIEEIENAINEKITSKSNMPNLRKDANLYMVVKKRNQKIELVNTTTLACVLIGMIFLFIFYIYLLCK